MILFKRRVVKVPFFGNISFSQIMKIGNVSPESHIRDILNDIDTYTVECFDPDINALCINFKDVTGTLFSFNRSDMIFISQTESN